MSDNSTESYTYNVLSAPTSFRVMEPLPGSEADPISCSLHDTGFYGLMLSGKHYMQALRFYEMLVCQEQYNWFCQSRELS